MKKLLPLKSIKNKTLRERKDKSLFVKTAVHRYHNDGEETFKKWLLLLTPAECREVKDLFLISHNHWKKSFGLPYGLEENDSVWLDVLAVVAQESDKHYGYFMENAILTELKKKFIIRKKK